MGYSSNVRLTIEVNGKRLGLTHVEPAQVRLSESVNVDVAAGTPAILNITVDGRCDSFRIVLPEGINASSEWVVYRRMDGDGSERHSPLR